MKWDIRDPDYEAQRRLGHVLGFSPIIAQILANRGFREVKDARDFMTGCVTALYNPFLMKGMREAVSRIKKAVRCGEKVIIHGDYDVDGVTSVSLLVYTLRNLGLSPAYFIPDRLTEGYGLGPRGVQEAIDSGAGLVITVDCGISSRKEVKELNKNNIDVIITDHHEVSGDLPDACAVINPVQEGCAYPDKNLSGVSVAFKLCEALCSEFDTGKAWEHLDLVALGTISDVAPLIGENRILVKEGLRQFKEGRINKGIQALIEESGIKNRDIGAFEIGFILGPRINAAGRMDSARDAVELLICEDISKAKALAKRLNDANRKRQRIESATLREAMLDLEREINFKKHKVIVLHKEKWHPGVIGIVASRISDRFYRPCILISTKDGIGRGSGRSIENFHLFDAVYGCREYLEEFGGHKYACGITIVKENLTRFKDTINEIADSMICPDDLIPRLSIDAEADLDLVDEKMVEDIDRLGPFGELNPEPVLCSRRLTMVRPPVILKGEHIKVWVSGGEKIFEAIGFGLARQDEVRSAIAMGNNIDLAYTLSFNKWQGLRSIQLKIKDIKAC